MNLLREYGNVLLSVLILTLIFSLLELLAPAEKGQALWKRLVNLAYLPFVLGLVILFQIFLGPIYSRALGMAGGGLLPVFIRAESSFAMNVLFALFYAVVFDVWAYWTHRLQHMVPFLWETHKFHHSETALNSSTVARAHALSHLLLQLLYLPVLITLGPQTPHLIALFLMFRVWGFVNHSNIRLNLGRLTPVVSGPHWHRIHHSIYEKHYNKNFATFFPFIDLLFGTYHKPERDEYPQTGLPAEEQEGYLRQATISPFTSWYKTYR